MASGGKQRMMTSSSPPVGYSLHTATVTEKKNIHNYLITFFLRSVSSISRRVSSTGFVAGFGTSCYTKAASASALISSSFGRVRRPPVIAKICNYAYNVNQKMKTKYSSFFFSAGKTVFSSAPTFSALQSSCFSRCSNPVRRIFRRHGALICFCLMCLFVIFARIANGQRNITSAVLQNIQGVTHPAAAMIDSASDGLLNLSGLSSAIGQIVSTPFAGGVPTGNDTETTHSKDITLSFSSPLSTTAVSFPLFSTNIVRDHLSGTIDVMASIAKSFNSNLNALKDSVLTALPVLSDVRKTVIVCYRNYNPLKILDMFMQRNTFLRLLVEAVSLILPVRSIYLRNLGMEIFEVPDPFRLSEFLNTLASFTQFVENVFEDQELGGFEDEIHQNREKEARERMQQEIHKIREEDLYSRNLKGGDTVGEKKYTTDGKNKYEDEVEIHGGEEKGEVDEEEEEENIIKVDMMGESKERRLLGVEPNDPFFARQWAHTDMGKGWGIETPRAWEHWTGTRMRERFLVALIDSGVDYNHPDLKESIWTNTKEICDNGIDDDKNGFIDDCKGWDFINNDNDPMDDNGHGTQSAGVIAAEPENGIGITGICWKCSLMVLKALNKDIQGTVSGFVRAIDYAIGQGAKVSNNSYGGRGSDFAALRAAVKRAETAGMIFVAAAGNYRGNNDNEKDPVYPASYEYGNVISVAAATRSGGLASFSSYGRRHVHIAAPGENIFTCNVGGGYKSVDGTSFAVPSVTGAVVLVWTREPQLTYREIVLRILNYTKYSPQLDGKIQTKGILNVWAAMTMDGTNLSVTSPHAKPPRQCAANNPCSPHATCTDTEIGPQCTCNAGMRGDGYNCQDIDECEFAPCGPAAKCINNLGSFQCVCREGFKQVGDSCTDIDECAIPSKCPKQATCINFVGSYDCLCPSGSAWNAKDGNDAKCLKINSPTSGPCVNNGNCFPNSLCKAVGTFWHQGKECRCLDGYRNVPDVEACVREGVMEEQTDYYLDVIKTYRQHVQATPPDFYQTGGGGGKMEASPPPSLQMIANPDVLSTDFADYANQQQNGMLLRRNIINAPTQPSTSPKPNNCMFGICLFAMGND